MSFIYVPRAHSAAPPRAVPIGAPLALFAVASCLTLAGCGGPNRTPVYKTAGKVTFQNQPIDGAFLVLHPGHSATTDSLRPTAHVKPDGTFEPTTFESGDGAPAGEYVVTVEWHRLVLTAGLVDQAGSGMLPKNGDPRMADVTDGLSNTIMYGESAGRPYVYRRNQKVGSLPNDRVNAGGWARPASDFSIDGSSYDGATLPGPCPLNCANGEPVGSTFPHPYYGSEGTAEAYAFHPGGANFGLGDGSVRFISQTINIREFARLVTRAGGEVVGDF